MSQYGKVFASLWTGSMMGKPDAQLVFVYMLAHCTATGNVDASHEHIAACTGIPIKRVRAAVRLLEARDPRSRSPEEDGRRIVRLDKHRDWGWRIVNHHQYRLRGTTTTSRSYLYYVGVPGDPLVYIGVSTNPWARLADLRARGGPLLADRLTLRLTVPTDERDVPQSLAPYHVDAGWYRVEGPVAAAISNVVGTTVATPVATVATPITTVATKTEAEAEAEAEAKAQPEKPALFAPVLTLPTRGGPGYPITQDMLDTWRLDYHGVDPLREAKGMLAWLTKYPGRRKTPRGMDLFCRKWLAGALDDAQAKGGGHRAGPDARWMAENAAALRRGKAEA